MGSRPGTAGNTAAAGSGGLAGGTAGGGGRGTSATGGATTGTGGATASTGGATASTGGVGGRTSTGGTPGGTGGKTSTGGSPGATGGSGSNVSCGNGKVDTGEDCEGTNLNGKTCSALGFTGGVLACAASCTFNVGGCSSGASAPKVNVVASRSMCAAPCGVFFDATGTAGLQNGDYVNANFNWDFDSTNVDPTASHRKTIGFVTAHVFDQPGTYQVAVRVTDTAGQSASTTVPITVVPMSGTVYYVSTKGSDSNSGTSMSSPFLTLSAALKKAGTNVSILLRRGDTFSMGSGEYDIDATGPFLLGAYTDPSAPSSAAPVLSSANTGNILVLGFHNGNDMRLTDIHIVSTAQASMGVWDDSPNNLLERVEIEGVGVPTGGSLTFNINAKASPSFFVDCHVHDIVGYGLWGDKPQQFAMVGTTIERYSAQDHGVRIQGGRHVDMCNCGGAALDPGYAGPSYFAENTVLPLASGSNVPFDSTAWRGDNSNVVYVNNVDSGTASFTPQNQQVSEYVSNVLFEGNLLNGPNAVLSTRAQNLTARNNIIIDNDSNVGYDIDVENAANLPSNWVTGVKIYNNTIFKSPLTSYSKATDTVRLLKVMGTTGTVMFENNIWYQTFSAADSLFLWSDGSAAITENHNLAYAPNVSHWSGAPSGTGDIVADPKFVTTPPAGAADVKLQATSPAKDSGTTVTTPYDYLQTASRPQGSAYDMGAWEYVSGN